jgi:hypothetical protein
MKTRVSAKSNIIDQVFDDKGTLAGENGPHFSRFRKVELVCAYAYSAQHIQLKRLRVECRHCQVMRKTHLLRISSQRPCGNMRAAPIAQTSCRASREATYTSPAVPLYRSLATPMMMAPPLCFPWSFPARSTPLLPYHSFIFKRYPSTDSPHSNLCMGLCLPGFVFSHVKP